MSTVGSATSVLPTVTASRTSVQIAVPLHPDQMKTSDVMLEAAVRRVATLLYMRAHYEIPPDAIDMGGGVFNVVV